ncbi:MAG: zinc finger Ran-binding domain-containing protein [Proteobacteria bacterium]|nr:zinc finger Ran-binding domain-containing protein [Pseudomonadota bacterium]
MAQCPNCKVENAPTNTTCEVCQAPLSGDLLERAETAGRARWMWISLAITLGLYLPCWFLQLHPVTLAMAMFYGPLIASYRAKDNVVWAAALGGLIAIVTVVVLSVMVQWEASRAILSSAVGGKEPTDYATGTSSAFVVVVGIPLVLAAIFPVSLIGASVGELVSTWRRRRSLTAAEQISRKMSDEELAKVSLK